MATGVLVIGGYRSSSISQSFRINGDRIEQVGSSALREAQQHLVATGLLERLDGRVRVNGSIAAYTAFQGCQTTVDNRQMVITPSLPHN
jgi:hypothetical protein